MTGDNAGAAGDGLNPLETEVLLKNEEGEDLLGPIRLEEDLALMRMAGEDNAAVSTAGMVDDRGQEGEKDEKDDADEDEDLLLDLMADIDDESMYAAMKMRQRGPEEEVRPGNFGGLKPGFLKGATPKARPPPPVVIGDVRERQTRPARGPALATTGEAEKPVSEKKPVSRFKLSLHR